jgi:hypothetical protein
MVRTCGNGLGLPAEEEEEEEKKEGLTASCGI